MLEGEAGFYHAYAGNNHGELTYSFTGDLRTSLDRITGNLGKEWMILDPSKTPSRLTVTCMANLSLGMEIWNDVPSLPRARLEPGETP